MTNEWFLSQDPHYYTSELRFEIWLWAHYVRETFTKRALIFNPHVFLTESLRVGSNF